MQGRIFAIIALILLIQPTLQNTLHASDSVIGNILFENAAMIPLAIILLIVTLMI